MSKDEDGYCLAPDGHWGVCNALAQPASLIAQAFFAGIFFWLARGAQGNQWNISRISCARLQSNGIQANVNRSLANVRNLPERAMRFAERGFDFSGWRLAGLARKSESDMPGIFRGEWCKCILKLTASLRQLAVCCASRKLFTRLT